LSLITWARPKTKERKGGPVRIWSGNRGEYEVTSREEFMGVGVYGPKFQATVRLQRPDGGSYSFFVVPHKRFKTLNAAQQACEKHKKENPCLSTNTPAPAATKPKNSNRSRAGLASALLAAKRKDSSDKSAKPASLNLEARLSRNTPGAPAKAEASKALTYTDYRALVELLEGTADSVEKAMEALNFDLGGYDMNAIEAGIVDCGLERCGCCDWWFECGELVCEENDYLTGICPECR
jgi:hypothetical protein